MSLTPAMEVWETRRTLERKGVVLIGNFFLEDDAADVAAMVNDVYDLLSAEQDLEGGLASNFHGWQGVWLEPLPAYLESHDAALAERYAEIIEQIIARVAFLFGPDWRLLASRSFFRRHVGNKKGIGWHADADAAALIDQAADSINIWVPLEDVGEDRPSLDFIPASHQIMRKVPLLMGDSRIRDEQFATNIAPAITPILGLGQALAFDMYTLHRTPQTTPADARRTSCEFRFGRGLPSTTS